MVHEAMAPDEGDGQMTDVNAEEILGSLDFNALKELRDKASKRIQLERNKRAKRVTTYISAEVRDDFDTAVQWAYEHNLIKRPSEWLFCQMVTRNGILFMMEQKRAEDLKKARTAAAMSSQMVSGAQQPAQNTPDTTKTL